MSPRVTTGIDSRAAPPHILNSLFKVTNIMEQFKEFLKSASGTIHLSRSGLGTRCKLATQFVEQGHNVVFLAHNRDTFLAARALLSMFFPEISLTDAPFSKEKWHSPLVSLPPLFLAKKQKNIWHEHISSLFALKHNKSHCILLTPESLLLRFMPINFFDEHELNIDVNSELDPDLLLEQVISWGYERVSMVTKQGDIARRGDIVDIYPTGYEKPLRMEFFGDTIEEIRIFDAASQRSLESIKSITILPAHPIGTNDLLLKKAEQRWKRLLQKKLITEKEYNTFINSLSQDPKALLPGTYYDAASVIEEWLPKNSIWILPGEEELSDSLSQAYQNIEDFTEEEYNLKQSIKLAARDLKNKNSLWENNKKIYTEPLLMCHERKGLDMPERALHSFSDLLPLAAAQDRPWQHLVKAIKQWQREKKQVITAFTSERGRKKFLNLAEQDGLFPQLRYSHKQQGFFALIAPVHNGIDLSWDNTLILGEDILHPKIEKSKHVPSKAFRGLDHHDTLKNGNLLVHRDYGIGRFSGLHRMELGGVANDYLLLEYSGSDKLYVPADRLSLIQKFKGGEGIEPSLDRLGSAIWSSGKEKARKAIEQIAADIIEMYAYRKIAKGYRYGPPGEIFREFEATFGFEETPDQARAIQDVLNDMDKPEPMDRLVCGDVGFGKTEVALRASFRAAADGRQVAMLCPTTVLAEQHYQTFKTRLANFPINVGLLSRFVSKQKQKQVLDLALKGQIDIIIGTHRILSADVKLPNLGLLILDEEQRFGVRHKEKLKAFKKNVDVLTLTATPIPRTLQLSMSGVRELSIIETAPPERKPVATAIIRKDKKVLQDILKRELERKGQIFWVYNRIKGLDHIKDYIHELVPNARIGLAHGQLPEKKLEETMHLFWHGELDILVCTSIIESGLDFPRANTLIVDQAQMFGLGQLYQIRGRVGRSDLQAYAVFIVPDADKLTKIAHERLRIILELDYLGAGFQLAMEDLRLRGAGNILGEVQTGHMSRIGLDLYLEMLEEAVARLKGSAPIMMHETEMNLGLTAHIPESYINDSNERLRCYKALTSASDNMAREDIELGIRDRFGSFPPEFNTFLAILALKTYLTSLQVKKADVYEHKIKIYWSEQQNTISPEKLFDFVQSHKGARLLPPAILEIPLNTQINITDRLEEIHVILSKLQID